MKSLSHREASGVGLSEAINRKQRQVDARLLVPVTCLCVPDGDGLIPACCLLVSSRTEVSSLVHQEDSPGPVPAPLLSCLLAAVSSAWILSFSVPVLIFVFVGECKHLKMQTFKNHFPPRARPLVYALQPVYCELFNVITPTSSRSL